MCLAEWADLDPRDKRIAQQNREIERLAWVTQKHQTRADLAESQLAHYAKALRRFGIEVPEVSLGRETVPAWQQLSLQPDESLR